MNVETLTKIIELVVTLLGIIISTYVIPYVKSRYDESELKRLQEYIEFGVRCAEMYFDTTQGQKKKEFVLANVKAFIQKLTTVELTDAELDAFIEGIVNKVKYSEYIVKEE